MIAWIWGQPRRTANRVQGEAAQPTGWRLAPWIALLLLLIPVVAASAQSVRGDLFGQPPNLGELKQQLLSYRGSGAYERDLAAVAAQAEYYVKSRAGNVPHPALVLDIDETSLSNWPQMRANDFGYIAGGPCNLPKGPCGTRAWETSGRAAVIGPTLKLFNAARAAGVSVFFITGRDNSERKATEANLRRAGYRGWTALIMRPTGTSTKSAADYKAPERAKIEARGITIIANVGDQPSDLDGGHAERGFLLPNPFYRIP